MLYIFLMIALVLLIGFAMYDYRKFFKKRQEVYETFKKIDTRFGTVEYLDWGNPKDPAILISYGGGTGIDFIYSLEWLKEARFRLIAVNRPGYYSLPIDVANKIEEHADIYNEVISHLNIEKIHVLGMSMGGLSALYYAQNYPTESLALWCAITGEYEPNQEAIDSPLGKIIMSDKGKKFISWSMARSAKLFPKETIASFIKTEAYLTNKEINKISKEIVNNPKQKKRMLQFIESMAPMNLIYDGMMDEVMKSKNDNGIQWDKITMPVLAIASTIDKDVPIEHINRVEKNVIHANIKHVKNAGHFIWWGEKGDDVLIETLEFFKSKVK